MIINMALGELLLKIRKIYISSGQKYLNAIAYSVKCLSRLAQILCETHVKILFLMKIFTQKEYWPVFRKDSINLNISHNKIHCDYSG